MSKPTYTIIELTDQQAVIYSSLLEQQTKLDPRQRVGYLEGVDVTLDQSKGNMRYKLNFTPNAHLVLQQDPVTLDRLSSECEDINKEIKEIKSKAQSKNSKLLPEVTERLISEKSVQKAKLEKQMDAEVSKILPPVTQETYSVNFVQKGQRFGETIQRQPGQFEGVGFERRGAVRGE